MSCQSSDVVVAQWGERLLYPDNRIVKAAPTPRLETMIRRKAAVIRKRIEAIVVRRAPQAMVKIVGGGRGMRAIKAQLRYITRNGSLEMEDDRGVQSRGKSAIDDIAFQWRCGGSLIEDVSHRKEALYVTLSMPHGTDPALVLKAARAFARAELPENQYVMVLHEHQANPHVHMAVRAQSKSGRRLNPWSDRHRWRETFAQKLRYFGVDAEATPQTTRGEYRRFRSPWLVQEAEHRKASDGTSADTRRLNLKKHAEAMQCWSQIMRALAGSDRPEDRTLAQHIAVYIQATPLMRRLTAPQYEQPAPVVRSATQTQQHGAADNLDRGQLR